MFKRLIPILIAIGVPSFSLAQVTVTPTLVSYQSGAAMYCAARWNKPQLQVYCYRTVSKTFDTLSFNSIYPTVPNNALVIHIPQNYNLPTGKNTITWIFNNDGIILHWQASINGLIAQFGTFQ